jgi:hypothetical protein
VRIQQGKEEIKGEEMPTEDDSKNPPVPPAPEHPKKRVYIEPKHSDNVAFGPAIGEAKVFIKHEGDVNLEFHTKTVTNADGSTLSSIVGWSENGAEYAIPMKDKYPAYFEIPNNYKVPEGVISEGNELYCATKIQEYPDGTVRAEIHYGKNSSYSYGWITLERKDAPAQPAQQKQPEQQKPAEEKKPEVPKSNYNPNKATTKSLEELDRERKTPTFDILFFDREDEFYDIAESNGWDIGEDSSTARPVIESKLRESYPNEKIDLDAINDVDNLMEMIRNCKK